MELIVERFEGPTTNRLYEVLKLRVSIFVVEQNCPYQEIDDKDRQALHVYLRNESGIQAYLKVIEKRVTFDGVSTGGVAAIKRRYDMDNRILAEGMWVAKSQLEANTIKIETQTYTKELYEKQGFR